MKIKHFTIIGIVSILLAIISDIILLFFYASSSVTIYIDISVGFGISVFLFGYIVSQKQWTKFKIINLICLALFLLSFLMEIINAYHYSRSIITNNSLSLIFALFSLGLFLSKPKSKLLLYYSLFNATICVIKFITSNIPMAYSNTIYMTILYSSSLIILIPIIILLIIMLKMQTSTKIESGE